MVQVFTGTTNLGDVAIALPSSIQYFAQHGIDSCCSGNKTLAELAAMLGEPLEALLERLDSELEREGGCGSSWLSEPVSAITRHLKTEYHGRVKDEIFEISSLIEQVQAHHAASHPEVFLLKQVFQILAKDLLAHIAEEERMLFPRIEALEVQVAAEAQVMDPVIAASIHRCKGEHGRVATLLRELRRLTGNYVPPSNACALYRSMLAQLRELEDDLRMQLHIENNVLFPKVLFLCNGSQVSPSP